MVGLSNACRVLPEDDHQNKLMPQSSSAHAVCNDAVAARGIAASRSLNALKTLNHQNMNAAHMQQEIEEAIQQS